jgi:hypothetical protein
MLCRVECIIPKSIGSRHIIDVRFFHDCCTSKPAFTGSGDGLGLSNDCNEQIFAWPYGLVANTEAHTKADNVSFLERGQLAAWATNTENTNSQPGHLAVSLPQRLCNEHLSGLL